MLNQARASAHLSLLLMATLALGCQQSTSSESPAPTNELVGAWSMTSIESADGSPAIDPSQPGLFIFGEGHYSAVFAPGAAPRVKSATTFQPTEEEMIDQYESIIVNTGTYEISGSTLTFRPIIAKSPGFVGGYQTSTFEVDGNTLVIRVDETFGSDGASPPEPGSTLRLTRIE